jgi:hypothetical protein
MNGMFGANENKAITGDKKLTAKAPRAQSVKFSLLYQRLCG